MELKRCKWQKSTNGFDYYFEKELAPGEEILLKMPAISPNKRGVNDIGWQVNGDIELWATLSYKPESASAIWTKIENYDEVNKTVSYIKIINNDEHNSGRVAIKALLN